jgi:hypothetical protein
MTLMSETSDPDLWNQNLLAEPGICILKTFSPPSVFPQDEESQG